MCYFLRRIEIRRRPFRNKTLPSRVVSWGLWFSRKKKLMEEKQKKWLAEVAQSRSTDIVIDPPSPIRRHVKWKMGHTKKTGQMMSKAAKEIRVKIVSHFHLLVTIFYNNCWMCKQILFRLFTIGFLGGACLTGKLCHPWTLGCTDYYHWMTRAPWSCSWCWSRCHHRKLLWTGFKGLSHLFVHGCWRPREADTKYQRPTGGVDHTKSDSTINDILQPDAIANVITGTHTVS